MAFQMRNFLNENSNIEIIEQHDPFIVIRYKRDLSVYPNDAAQKYFLAEMQGCQKQVLCKVDQTGIVLASKAMQYMLGDVTMKSNVRGVGDLIMKSLKSSVTKDSAVKPIYTGSGIVSTEPTYKHLLIMDVGEWDGMVCDDGMFVACQGNIQYSIVARTNISSAVLGQEGFFNTCLTGRGYAVIQSPVAREELLEIDLQNDVMKIDGNMAVAWSRSLNFSVEKAATTLTGSALSGEGFVNVYRGTGKILMRPCI